jgi:hypothetical protein
MKKMSLIGLVMLLLLAACAPYMYGVPQETWDRMGEPERVEAMRVYELKQQARRQAAEERARRQAAEDQARRQAAEAQARREALERERAQARQAALERERRERIERIHRGEGIYGELIRVRLQGGKIRLGDRHHSYEPVTFTIADGETRKIGVADRQGRVFDLTVTYAGGALSLEGVRFPYDRSWGKGRLYANTGTSGAHELRGVDLFIEVHDRSSHVEREQSRLVIIREPDPPVVTRERDAPKPPPVIVRTNDPPKPPSRPPAPLPAELPPRGVEIVLLAGELKVHGQVQQLERTSLHMTEGESRDLVIKAGGEGRTLSLHYGKGELTIDGTPGRGRDAVRISYEKEWKGGKVYRLELKGKVALEKLDVRVTGLAN